MLDRDMTAVVDPGRAAVAVTGEVDASNAEDLCLAILAAAMVHGSPLEVDLAGVTFMDSTGLRAITDAAHALEASGSALVLSNMPRQVRRIMQISGLGSTLEVRG